MIVKKFRINIYAMFIIFMKLHKTVKNGSGKKLLIQKFEETGNSKYIHKKLD